jgi:leucyl-tRNA synthetase
MAEYNPQAIEPKWQQYWDEHETFKAKDNARQPKQYVLDMFPYASGSGLHVGHPKGYIATDVYSRFKMMQGYNVLHPMGWDSFGLPAENYAIKNKIHPRITVGDNIARFKKQLQKIGFTYDWSREINTTDPEYYKWTQWIFLQLFKKGLAYESHEPINWCPSCQTGLANEDVEDGQCERCGTPVERRPMRQWVLKITAYADRLLQDLDQLEWPESIKESQRNWIGRSEGLQIPFKVKGTEDKILVFTTRPDTIFGATYVVLAPEHELVRKLKIENRAEVVKYVEQAKNKTEIERTAVEKEKTGVELKGVQAINPATGRPIPIWISDYVLASYGTGAIMAVPAHDSRDYAFAHQHGLPLVEVVHAPKHEEGAWEGEGQMVHSGEFDGLDSTEAREKMIKWLIKKVRAERQVNYKIRDWVFSRQRYWGEPIPVIHCEKCGVVPVPEDQLPVVLPEVEHYEPAGTGESPLASITDWVTTTCPQCGGPAKRETNTMPQWAGSSWYYLRYIDPKNTEELVDSKKEKYWMPVDMYVGGAEHATRHLIYARFWHKFLYDEGVVSTSEPFTKLQHVGLILAEDGKKMSKRWGNVINPDDIVAEHGADTLRVYEMFMGPFNESVAWSTRSIAGPRRFLDRVWDLVTKSNDTSETEVGAEVQLRLHQTIKRVTEGIEHFRFNTAIAALMEFMNVLEKEKAVSKSVLETLVLLLSPFAPHIAEELWQQLGHRESLARENWPKIDESILAAARVTVPVQVNGKVRGTLDLEPGTSQEEAEQAAKALENVTRHLEGVTIQKVVFVPDRLLNFVVKK